MGSTLSMTVERKHNGLPYHLLTPDQQEAIDTIDSVIEVFYSGKYQEMIDFTRSVSEELSTEKDREEGSIYLYIDKHNVESVLAATKAEIDKMVEQADKYDPETYDSYGELHSFASFYKAVKDAYSEDGFETKYLFINIGW